jgi:hypothetical protein
LTEHGFVVILEIVEHVFGVHRPVYLADDQGYLAEMVLYEINSVFGRLEVSETFGHISPQALVH